MALVVALAAAVVALGLLAQVAAPPTPSGAPVSLSVVRPPAPVVVTVEPGETVWEVADRVAPGLSVAERAALAQRIVADNGLGSARPAPGRVLRVVAG
jgi:Tfp pilus assembly protein FimV